jgi:serine-type D-Ala-D-Ala carboxypeptidase (penicillin-binding protein 5/6)
MQKPVTWWRRRAGALSAGTVLAVVVVAVTLFAGGGSALAVPTVPDVTITASFPGGEPPQPEITATAAFLIDADSGKSLFSKNANQRLPMASTTKIMTAILVLEKLDPQTKVTVSANAVSVEGSIASLAKGEVLTVDQLLHGLLIISGNDAAVALAEAVGGSVAHFVEMMNAKAKEMGLENTHFVNPHGVQPKGANASKHYSSAKDLATMAQYAMKFPLFREIVDSESITLPALPGQTKPRYWDHNGNELLMKVGWVTGIKTGSTPYAKYCLVASGTKDGSSMIAVVLGAETSERRWNEARRLMEYGFSLRPANVLVGSGQRILELDVPDILGRKVTLVADRAVTAHLKQGDVVTRQVLIDRDPVLPVRAGEVFGRMRFTLAGETLGAVNLVAAQPVTRPTLRMVMYYFQKQSPLRFVPRA